ncbi:MAG: hypothetical protein JXA21_11445 [Anaerolineae bacterium]|nr:hypothetical protein [Anaerolineae bacterium]
MKIGDWEVESEGGHIAMHFDYSHRRPERRECVEFVTARGGRFYIVIADGETIPAMNYQQALEWAQHGSIAFDVRPASWTVRATFTEPAPRCVRLAHPGYGECYVPLRDGATIPTTLDELTLAAATRPGYPAPCGPVVGEILLGGAECTEK